jgi:hypothetical protein
VAKQCGVLSDDETLDNMIVQQYVNMYKDPLTDTSMEAILKLNEVGTKKKKKNKVKKDKKEEERCILKSKGSTGLGEKVEKLVKKKKKALVGTAA